MASDEARFVNGTVVDASQIDKVAEIVRGVPGVTSVTNKLTVKMVLPLGLFIFPVVLLVVMLPVMIKLLAVLK